jgi:hypothetical protein
MRPIMGKIKHIALPGSMMHAYWQAANITQLIFVRKNAVNKHLPQI